MILNKFCQGKSEIFHSAVNGDYRADCTYQLEYYLIESEYEKTDPELGGEKVYGIEITKKVMVGEKVAEVDTETVFDFSCSRDKVLDVLASLKRCTVTPISLKYILEDLLCI